MGIRGARRGSRSEADELAVYREFVRQLTETCEAAARGDLEARSRPAPAAGGGPRRRALHPALNRGPDVSDAFLPGPPAAPTSPPGGRFPRPLLQGGLPGAVRKGA